MLSNLARSASELPEYGEVLRNLIARDLKAKYQSRALGLGWSLVHPADWARARVLEVVVRRAGA